MAASRVYVRGLSRLWWSITPVVAVCLLASAASAAPPAAARGADAERAPRFSLEQLATHRVPGQFVLSPDRRSVVYTHVSRFFGHPIIPGFDEDSNLFLLDLDNGARVRLTSGADATAYPAFSPDGRYVAYESQGNIWSVEIESGRTQRLTTHVSRDRGAAWSPDGSEIAFASGRWGRPALYVMAATGERDGLRQITPDGFGGLNPVWSPDGEYILFIASRDEHFYSRAIYRVPAAGGEPERLTPRDDARNNWPTFSPDGTRIAYLSDRSGYLNLWEMTPDGREHRHVYAVEEDQDYAENDYIQTIGPRWSPDGTQLLHFTNRLGNLLLISVDVASGEATRLGGEEGGYHPVGWLADDTVAFVHESYRRPPDLYLMTLGESARQVTHSGHAALGEHHFDRLESVWWTSEDGVRVHGYLRRPSWSTPEDRLPGIVFSHTYNVGQFYNQWNPIFGYMAESGYVLLFVNHRGSSGYGREFRDLPRGGFGQPQQIDIVSGAEFLRAQPGVDPDRLGMLGYSMGGYLTQLALTTRPEVFDVGVSVFGLGEITWDPQRSHQNFIWHLGGTQEELPDAWAHASPVNHVEHMRAPLLIVHSDGDPIEPLTKVWNFVHEMERHDKPYEVRIYRNEAHGLQNVDNLVDAYHRIMVFLDRHLR